jgi:bifunctional DNA-binding transcriptional regulator/antitoxin component of YhaV-PrlF toxin-antitoxin module
MSEQEEKSKETASRQVQKLGRVAIPGEWLGDVGFDIEDDVVLIKEENEVRIVNPMKLVEDEG